MAIDIVFGATSGITAESEEKDVSFGKLYTGGLGIYLYVQNKIQRKSVAKTEYASCSDFYVMGITSAGAWSLPAGPAAAQGTYPVESVSAQYQEEPNIVWEAKSPGNTPPEVTSGTDPNTIAPATIAACIQIFGYNANFSVSVKGKDDKTFLEDFDPKTYMQGITTQTICNGTNFPDSPPWNKSYSMQKQRADWLIFTRSGKGYKIGANLSQNVTLVTKGTGTPLKEYYSVSFSASAKGDVTKTDTIFEILET